MKLHELKSLRGKPPTPCVATLSDDVHSVEDIPQLIETIKTQIEAQGGSIKLRMDVIDFLNADGNTNGQFYNLPKLHRVRKGTIEIKSAGYVFSWHTPEGEFRSSEGKLPNASEMTSEGFFLMMFNGGRILYKIGANND